MYRYLELIRFSHTFFALPFAVLSTAMAMRLGVATAEMPRLCAGVLLCMVFGRSAAMSFNRWADRHIDAENPRTAKRHIPSGILSARNVLVFTALCSLGFVGSSCLFLPRNPLPLLLSVPALVYIFGYSFAKRWTIGSHFWLGGSLLLAPLGAWIAIRPEIALAPVLLGLAVLFWTAGFDVLYATQDYEFDRAKGLRSIPARFGIRRSLHIAAGCHLLMLVLLGLLPLVYPPFGPVYYIGLGIIAAILLLEHGLIRPRKANSGEPIDLSRINIAFFYMNVLISFGLLLFGAIDLWV